jgi:hypothetical protein
MRNWETDKEEEKIFLSLSAGRPSGETVREISQLFAKKKDSIDFDLIFAYASENEVAPIIYETLRAFDTVPAEVLKKFRNAYLHSFRNNVLNAEEMLRVLRSLAKGGVEAMPLKGSLASEFIFETCLYRHQTSISCQTGGHWKS